MYNNVSMQIFRTILSQQSLVYNQVSSYDHLVSSDLGVKNILQNMFSIRNAIPIDPTPVEVNGKVESINSILATVQFKNVQVSVNPVESEDIQTFV